MEQRHISHIYTHVIKPMYCPFPCFPDEKSWNCAGKIYTGSCHDIAMPGVNKRRLTQIALGDLFAIRKTIDSKRIRFIGLLHCVSVSVYMSGNIVLCLSFGVCHTLSSALYLSITRSTTFSIDRRAEVTSTGLKAFSRLLVETHK